MRAPKSLRPSDTEAGPSGLQTLPRRERTPESQLLFLVSGVPRNFFRGGGGQQIQLRTEDREDGDLEAVAP